jgi:hypothetical protein
LASTSNLGGVQEAGKIKEEDDEWIYIIDPNGIHERLR